MGDQENNDDSTDHINQHENTTIVPRHKPEDWIKSNKLLRLADTIIWSRDIDNYKITVVQTWCFEMWIYRRISKITWTEKITNEYSGGWEQIEK